MVPIIGITGLARHGKDTVGRMLLEQLPYFRRWAFADAMKAFGKAGFAARMPEEQCKEGQQTFVTSRAQLIHAALGYLHEARCMYAGSMPKNKENIDIDWLLMLIKKQHPDFTELPGGQFVFTSSWRHIWQILGTDWARACIDEDFWIEPFLPDDYIVVTDVRGHGDQKEKELVNNEALAIIQRGGLVIRVVDPRKQVTAIREHVSECGIDDEYITHTIINDGTLEDLQRAVMDFMYVYLFEPEILSEHPEYFNE